MSQFQTVSNGSLGVVLLILTLKALAYYTVIHLKPYYSVISMNYLAPRVKLIGGICN